MDTDGVNPGDLSWDGLKQFGEVTVYDRTPKDQVIARIGGAQAIFSNKVVIDAQIMDACPRMKFVGLLSTGYNVVDGKSEGHCGVQYSGLQHALSRPDDVFFAVGYLLPRRAAF